MSILMAMPNGQILVTILVISVLGLMLTSVGALLGIWTWKTPQSIALLIVGVVLFIFITNFVLEDSPFG